MAAKRASERESDACVWGPKKIFQTKRDPANEQQR